MKIQLLRDARMRYTKDEIPVCILNYQDDIGKHTTTIQGGLAAFFGEYGRKGIVFSFQVCFKQEIVEGWA